jgi:ribosomal protein S18 acetylase RimI-like enzyme
MQHQTAPQKEPLRSSVLEEGKIKILAAKPEDKQSIMFLFQQNLIYHHYLDKIYYHHPEHVAEKLEKYVDSALSSQDPQIYLAKNEQGESIGLVACGIAEPTYFDTAIEKFGSIYELFVVQEYRGLGLGQRLVKESEAYLKEKGCLYVHLQASSQNFDSLEFYKKYGFVDLQKHFYKHL